LVGLFLEAVKQNGDVLKIADFKLQKDKDIILEAIKQDHTAIQYADSETL